MRILLVDDSVTIRSLIRRALVQHIDVEIAEAGNGIEALALIVRKRFDLVVIDMNMPVMDGLEALEAIRTAPEYASLPVVMLTSEKNEALVRRLVELRITDFLSKPLSPESLAVRLARILERLRETAGGGASSGVEPHGRRVLVVEQDPDRRHFMHTALTGHYDVTVADSAAEALQLCLADPPPPFDIVVVGLRVGLPPVGMFLGRLRGIPHLGAARVVGCVPKGSGSGDARRVLFDAVVETTAIPEVFLGELRRAVLGQQSALTKLLLVRPTLAEDIVSATEQVFGLMLACEIESTRPGPPESRTWSDRLATACIDLTTEDGAALSLEFLSDWPAAAAIAAGMIGAEPQDVADEDVLATLGEIVNIIHGRFRNRLVDAGIPVTLGLPKMAAVAEPPSSCQDPDAIGVTVTVLGLNVNFALVLTARAGAR